MNCNFGAFYDDIILPVGFRKYLARGLMDIFGQNNEISPNQISANEYRQKIDNWFNEHAENQSNDELDEEETIFSDLRLYTEAQKNVLKQYIKKEFDCRIS